MIKRLFQSQKSAQAAVEFLTTYGWAIIALLVVISSLAYFGVFSPERSVGEHCTTSTGLLCEGVFIDGDSLKVVLLSGPERITVFNDSIVAQNLPVGCDSTNLVDISWAAHSELNLGTRERFGVSIDCAEGSLEAGMPINAQITFSSRVRGNDITSQREVSFLSIVSESDVVVTSTQDPAGGSGSSGSGEAGGDDGSSDDDTSRGRRTGPSPAVGAGPPKPVTPPFYSEGVDDCGNFDGDTVSISPGEDSLTCDTSLSSDPDFWCLDNLEREDCVVIERSEDIFTYYWHCDDDLEGYYSCSGSVSVSE